jgi:cystathionine beta-lyase
MERQGTGALALAHRQHGMPPDATPLWVADMAFSPPDAVREVLARRSAGGALGYSIPTDGYVEALGGWFARRHGWHVDPSTAVISRGVVHGLHLAIESLTEPGDGVLIQPPVYPPFFATIRATGRRLLTSPLVETPTGWQIDMEDFEAKAAHASAFILCSPHNPVGRVWSRIELERLADICLRHGVRIVSDEIHADFVYPDAHHTVMATLDREVDAATVTCTAPSKTFNVAGLQVANIFAADGETRRRMGAIYRRQGLHQHPALGLAACEAAYGGSSDAWVDELVAYLDGTMALIASFAARRLGAVGFARPEGTYLAWLDFRALGLDAAGLRRLVVDKARLWLSDGADFGAEGSGFLRLNAAFPRATIEDALERLARAVAGVAR